MTSALAGDGVGYIGSTAVAQLAHACDFGEAEILDAVVKRSMRQVVQAAREATGHPIPCVEATGRHGEPAIPDWHRGLLDGHAREWRQ